MKNYEKEVQNLANTVSLGVRIAITEQNFEGVQTAMDYVKGDPRLRFVSLIQQDTSWNDSHTAFQLQRTIFKTYPEDKTISLNQVSSDSLLIQHADFVTPVMSGSVLLGFSTYDIIESKKEIRLTSMIVSLLVFIIGISTGYVLARNISVPVLALRDAAYKVGQGDLSQRVHKTSKDEIGELGIAFNKMVTDLEKAQHEIKEVNASLASSNAELQSTLSHLKETQAQLIQAEKMASLGQLTAGIAHEIQNPLNFVNNFSEINMELIAELKTEMEQGHLEDCKQLAEDITGNEQKINHHGKRADAIVKGMLQNSRSSTGQKEATDINALCDEYLRLAYHGLRAKDKSFNASLLTDFDPSLSPVEVVHQDIGRVILNLITNAFYAVADKKKRITAGYQPTVSVLTKCIAGGVEIMVRDNGDGIPSAIREKIFQPFFTTKPTGEGTGLGLSLSYDIIHAHNGQMRVETKSLENTREEETGTTFILFLPC